MNKAKPSGIIAGTSLLSAIAASLCCITPILALFAGSSSVAANFSWLEPARPFLIGATILMLGFAWYRQLGFGKVADADCGCEVKKKTSFLQSRKFLVIITFLALVMMTFPLYAGMFYPKSQRTEVPITEQNNIVQATFHIIGMTCQACEGHVNTELEKVSGVTGYITSYASKSSVVDFDKSKTDLQTIALAIGKTGYKVKNYEMMIEDKNEVSFYEAPLICHAAPTIGCGSKAKFMLVELEKDPAIKGAWLNRTGTIVAVKWSTDTDAGYRSKLIQVIGEKHSIALKLLASGDAAAQAKTFAAGKDWYKGTEVDKLSREEAGIIARNTVEGYKKSGLVKASFEKQFEADIEKIYADLFLSINSYQELTSAVYDKVEEKIQKAGEKYVGKGKMPRVELCVAGESCEKDKSCSDNGESCCDKKQ